jgi:hypothetical protein
MTGIESRQVESFTALHDGVATQAVRQGAVNKASSPRRQTVINSMEH